MGNTEECDDWLDGIAQEPGYDDLTMPEEGRKQLKTSMKVYFKAWAEMNGLSKREALERD